MKVVNTSLFELFKVGPGPSSSHTMGPMEAACQFIRDLKTLPLSVISAVRQIQVSLYGSLSATGRGHYVDRAIIAGLSGYQPSQCPPSLLDSMGETCRINVQDRVITFGLNDLIFEKEPVDTSYSNTMMFRLIGEQGVLHEKECYSVGGGFIQWKDESNDGQRHPVYAYCSMDELKSVLNKERLCLHELVLENEQSISNLDERHIFERLDQILGAMEDAVNRGIETEGVLPGPLELHRKAAVLFNRAKRVTNAPDHFLLYLCAYAYGVAEENAAGHTVVTAPTCGSSGIIPAVYYVMKHHLGLSQESIRHGLLASSVVGFLAKHNASIAGAEVGCQGEIGVASSMAAAMLAYAHCRHVQVMENAAEIALEHHLGMTCDPVNGYVQIPCIERNAIGAVKAYTSYLIATVESSQFHMVGLDQAIASMAQTGRDMCRKYKETAEGGLATFVEC